MDVLPLVDIHIDITHSAACQWFSSKIDETINMNVVTMVASQARGSMNIPVGTLVRNRRKALGFTQRDLFQRTGIEQYYISQIETGKVKQPGKGLLMLIAEALDMAPNTLLIAADYAPIEEPVPLNRSELLYLPFYGRVPADYLRWTAAASEPEQLGIPSSFAVDAKRPILVQASGDCLREREISTDDYVIIDFGAMPRMAGDIVVVRIGDEVTMKEWHPVQGGVELRPSSDRYQPIFVADDQEDVSVIGTARAVVKFVEL
jgi:SOS-response transcriptional repressor LexA